MHRSKKIPAIWDFFGKPSLAEISRKARFAAAGEILFYKEKQSGQAGLFQYVEKSLRSRLFSFLCIRLCGIGKEDSNERNPSGVRFCSSQLGGKRSFSTS